MCQPLKGYIELLAQYKSEVVMILGFVLAGFVYVDNKELTRQQGELMREQTKALYGLTSKIDEAMNEKH